MEEYLIRLEKLKKLKEIKYPLYNNFKPTNTAKPLQKEFTNTDGEILFEKKIYVSLAGRILSIRDFGGSLFFHIQDHTGKIQCFLEKKKSEQLMTFFKEFVDTGDIVGLNGFLFKTKKGELTVYIESLTLLTKSIRGLPEKWHGLKDIETRYRQRYLDLIMNPQVREIFEKKSKTVSFIRRFFEERGFLEVETPLLHTIPGGALAKPFKTYHNALDIDLYMRIAPELYLKRLITGGMHKIFEIGRNFRNEGISSIHNPEFTMLEFYSAYSDYEELISLTEELLYKLAEFINGKPILKCGEEEIEIKIPFKRIDIPSVVSEFLNIPLNKIKDENFLKQKLGAKSKEFEDKTWGEIITEIFEKEISEKIKEPTFVLGFPVEVSPLAKRRKDDKDFVERFELVIFGLEIANAFSELCDPDDQRERFHEQLKRKTLREDLKELSVIDEDFLLSLEYGMPPVAGEGIGIDRLVMLLVGASSIKEVILFPTMKPLSID